MPVTNYLKYFNFIFLIFLIIFFISIALNFVSANTYVADVYFTIPETVYTTNERIELKGFVYQANYTSNGTLVTNSSALASALVNLTIINKNSTYASNYTFTTDANGTFYSRSNYYSSATIVSAPSSSGYYYLKASYKDINNITFFSQTEISVLNQTIDSFRISSEKSNYNPSETVIVNIEGIRLIDDKILYISNVSINGSLRNATKSLLQSFNCTTENNGKCSITLTAPSTYGSYILEAGNFKTFNSFSVTPFSYNIYMKDELGKSLKNIFAQGEQARVEVKINNASSSDIFTFSGYVADSSGNSISSITSTILNSTNSFTNSFLIDINARVFNYGTYTPYITVTKTGDGSITSLTSFEVQDWILTVNKKTVGSGFEYESSAFQNKTLKFEALPTYRSNGTVITNISGGSFTITIKDSLNNILSTTNATWNGTCGKSGCYEFSLTSPSNSGKYTIYTSLSYNGDTRANMRVINIINGVMSAQSTDKDGNVKELFGVNEYAYFSFSAYNLTSSGFNLSDAEVFIVSYMNGTEFSYTQMNNFSAVNSSNSVYEWAWNSSLQRIKMDFPKYGGVYDVYFFGNNRTLGASAKFIVNPYDMCAVPKDTAGTVSSGYYYVWQFKTSDTIYFEIKLIQANNPLGKASVLNLSGNSSAYGMGSACVFDITTRQVISNATLSVSEVKNLESGAIQTINTTASTCQSSDANGTYTCTVKPYSKWDGGQNIVKFNIQGQDGTTSIGHSMFEARAFYLYGWSSTWQNSPGDNITLNVRLYEAGSSWWSSYGSSGGISGTITLKRIEYMGGSGEWIWPPVDSGYNATNVSSAAITSGTGSISIPASKNKNGIWKTGNYRAVLQATTASGDTDYGYAWFGIKLWDVYGNPVSCASTGCSYQSYFNSKENITLYIKISKASSYSYGYSGGENIWGNVTVSVKKIQDCRKWPCKDLNSTQYSASSINVNASSPWYWNSVVSSNSSYLIYINTTNTSSTWGTGYYHVVLDVNGTDTGYAWFNAIAFYVEVQPVNSSRNYRYSIRGNVPMYFNITSTKSYKNGYWYNNSFLRYNQSDYINTTVDSIVLRRWDFQTSKQIELTYPTDLNVTPLTINGTALLNITYKNGTWPTAYYYGELTLRNSDNETSTGWLWFNVQPFRVDVYSTSYETDSDQCINASLRIYDSDWYSWSPLIGNYSVTSVYENIWSGNSVSTTHYNNFTNSSFNSTLSMLVCPNNGQWSSGGWGGYHSLNIIVKDNIQNDSQTGWLSFKTVPFRIVWYGTGGNRLTNASVNISVAISKPISGANTSGNLSKLYQWRYDNYRSTKEEYVFRVDGVNGVTCYSNVSGQCTISGVNSTANVTIYPPSGGWKIGSNYIQSEWVKDSDSSLTVQDWSGIYFEGRALYNGNFENSDINNNWKYYFAVNENITIKLIVKDSNNNVAANTTISSVEYAFSGNDCWSEYCRSYTTATWATSTGGAITDSNGRAVLNIRVPASNWSRGYYAVRATVGGVLITGGTVRVKDMIPPNITAVSSPVNNVTYNISVSINATTDKNSQCTIIIANYDNFYNWYCGGWNSTNSTSNSSSASLEGACNISRYNYNGSVYFQEYLNSNYHSIYDGSNHSYCSGSSCNGPESLRTTTFLTTGGLIHSYNLSVINYTAQYYGMNLWCYDDDYNMANNLKAFKVNNTGVS